MYETVNNAIKNTIMKLLQIFINVINFYENTFKVYQQFLR